MRIVSYRASFSMECSCQLSHDKDYHCTFLSHNKKKKKSSGKNHKLNIYRCSTLTSHMPTYYLSPASNILPNGGQLKTSNN